MLVQRRKIEEECFNVPPLTERTAQYLYPRAGRVGVARAQPSMAGYADATATFAHERNRLCGRQQRREAVLVLECLERLPPLDLIVVRVRKQPLCAQEADVAPREHLDEAIVERRQRLVYLER